MNEAKRYIIKAEKFMDEAKKNTINKKWFIGNKMLKMGEAKKYMNGITGLSLQMDTRY